MSEYDREIVEAIRKAAGTELKDDINIIQATVTNVYTPQSYTCDCEPVSGDTTDNYLGVSLSVNCNDSFILVPAKGSTVLLAVSTKNNPPYIIGYDTLQGVICVVQNPDNTTAQLLIQNGTIQLSNNYNNTTLQLLMQNGTIQLINTADGATGQIIIQNGTIQFNDGSDGGIPINSTILENLNAIMTYVNSIAAAISGAGSGDAVPGAVGLVAPSTAPTMADMQNTNVTHG